MNGFVQTLWDLLVPPPRVPRADRCRAGVARVAPEVARRPRPSAGVKTKYEAVVALMLARYGVRVRKWRKSMSGVAWELKYHDGRVKRLIESPKPKSPMSLAIFLHEIGHHAIGFNVYKPRCLEEYHAWEFAVRAMEEHGFEVTERVRTRMSKSLRYAGEKALRRGIKRLPDEIVRYMDR